MNPVTHAFSGWVLANVAPLERRDRLLVAASAVLPDVDGLGLVIDLARHWPDGGERELWEAYHHVLAHNLAACLVVSVLAAAVARRRLLVGALAFVGMHLHLLGDLLGSRGPDGYQWPIPYLSPFSSAWQLAWTGQWALDAWQNVAFTAALLTITLYLAWRRGFSPVELLSERADRVLVETLRARFGRHS